MTNSPLSELEHPKGHSIMNQVEQSLTQSVREQIMRLHNAVFGDDGETISSMETEDYGGTVTDLAIDALNELKLQLQEARAVAEMAIQDDAEETTEGRNELLMWDGHVVHNSDEWMRLRLSELRRNVAMVDYRSIGDWQTLPTENSK